MRNVIFWQNRLPTGAEGFVYFIHQPRNILSFFIYEAHVIVTVEEALVQEANFCFRCLNPLTDDSIPAQEDFKPEMTVLIAAEHITFGCIKSEMTLHFLSASWKLKKS